MGANRAIKRRKVKKVKEPTPVVNGMDLYNMPRQPGDLNLVDLIASHIDTIDTSKKVSKLFLNNNDIKSIHDKNQVVQRLIINRIFITELLVYRSTSGKVINNVLPFIANDGYIEDWITLMKEIVLPFFITNNIFLDI